MGVRKKVHSVTSCIFDLFSLCSFLWIQTSTAFLGIDQSLQTTSQKPPSVKKLGRTKNWRRKLRPSTQFTFPSTLVEGTRWLKSQLIFISVLHHVSAVRRQIAEYFQFVLQTWDSHCCFDFGLYATSFHLFSQ